MKKLFVSALMAIALMAAVSIDLASAQRPTITPLCKQCHQEKEGVVRGTLVGVSESFKTIQLATGKFVWVISYGDDLKLTGAEKLSGIPKEKEIAVGVAEKEGKPYALSLSVKPPAQLPAEKLISTEEVSRLIAEGPGKGNFVLIDSRPKARYLEGHLPYAAALPLSDFDSLKDTVLPKEKDRLVIFYCGGVT